ncbi:D-Ala-D-Ala carboxypeptidase family metallohydrolase [Arhodomonas sp. SL1]|uniref:D-Ala-D-Ala carboxypeptidase family metallohydrolase n=1 Tax=Arhodomonas sp. SL1 TaxID=3425691 RepID=UPI003F884D96
MSIRYLSRRPVAGHIRLLLCLSLILLPVVASAATERLSFSLRVADDINPYPVLGVYLQPGEAVSLAVAEGHDGRFAVEGDGGRLRERGHNRWAWQAPRQPGLYPLRVHRRDTGETMTLNAFVKIPREAGENGRLNGYRVGRYPDEPLRGLDIYRPPPGFVEVTAENEDVRVSPHFRLGQFVSKQGGGDPRYVVLRPRLLLLLEAIVEELHAQGQPVETLTVMSGFRTPWYNERIGNVEYSRHVWGGAADIFIDEVPPHGRMDDLNGDGVSDADDARWLAALVERVQRRSRPQRFVGGIGIYGPRSHRGAFVHVDVRGFEARWAAE